MIKLRCHVPRLFDFACIAAIPASFKLGFSVGMPYCTAMYMLNEYIELCGRYYVYSATYSGDMHLYKHFNAQDLNIARDANIGYDFLESNINFKCKLLQHIYMNDVNMDDDNELYELMKMVVRIPDLDTSIKLTSQFKNLISIFAPFRENY
jgi:hypothetical protein